MTHQGGVLTRSDNASTLVQSISIRSKNVFYAWLYSYTTGGKTQTTTISSHPMMATVSFINVLMPMHPGFDGMDFFGPVEILGSARRPGEDKALFKITTTASQSLTGTEQGHEIGRHISLEDAYARLDTFDMMIIAGGNSHEILNQTEPIAILKAFASLPQRDRPRTIMSVCTGALFLAKAGILHDRTAITNWQDIDRLEALSTGTIMKPPYRFVVDKKTTDSCPCYIMTSAGPGAGLDLSMWVLEYMVGKEVREASEALIQYNPKLDQGFII